MPSTVVEQEWIGRLPGLDRLWSMTRDSPDVRIAVLDGPVDDRLIPAVLAPAGAIEHGTHVHSILSGSDDSAVPGLAPQCTISHVAIFDNPDANGRYVCTQERLAGGIRDALAQRANVINISAAQQSDLLSLSAATTSASLAIGAAPAKPFRRRCPACSPWGPMTETGSRC